ncbi:iron complex transport system permease protein [Amphibacillus marinus]|uniref:Iron complex transport system permease protein n=1 Tax=Amphibacillus marinus TaxID=872970 RepID=A0A1H8LR09_9BACI|nr:iron ABC transporter permease [Amphibacillus marinus]SEO07298.1 iron complex transport system permease protein [Amphibacillus marinus]
MQSTIKKPGFIISILFILIILIFFVSLNTGFIRIPFQDIFRVLIGLDQGQNQLVIFQFRLPRLFLALLAGAGLAVSGSIFQGITQNELADPSILGISSGAGFAVVLFLSFYRASSQLFSQFSVLLLPFVAFLGGVIAALLIYLLAWKKGVTATRLILVGIAVNAAFGAGLIVLQLRLHPNDFMQATIWLSGSISNSSWNQVFAILPWTIILLPIAIYKANYLNFFTLGDPVAIGLGVEVEKERAKLLFLAVALAGSSVAVGGGIAFLALIVPHLTRKWVGANHNYVIPAAALMGALLLLIADMLARTLLAPSEIPVGLITSFIGAPYFIYLLLKV